MQVVEASWDGEGAVVGLGWALDPMQEATAVSVPILLVLQEDVHWKFFLEPIPTVELEKTVEFREAIN